MPVHVRIKRWERKPTELYGIAVLILSDNDVRPGLLILQLNFIAHELDILAARRIGRVWRNYEQAHMRTLFAANHFHDFVQPHLANIDKVSRTLPYGGNAVAHF